MKYSQHSSATPFDNDTNGFTSDNVQEAIEELKALLEEKNNFSYNKIIGGKELTIPVNQQMRVYQEIKCYGNLNIRGEIIVKDV